MATEDEIRQGITYARMVGDTDAVAKLEAMLPPQHPSPSGMLGSVRAGLQGMTFGGSDEVGAAVAAVPAAISDVWNGRGFHPVQAYKQIHSDLGKDREAFRREHPGKALGFEVGGGLATGGVGGYKAANTLFRNAPTMARVAGIGALEGGIYGTLAADQGERTVGGAKGAGWGATLGPALHGTGRVAGHIGTPIVKKLGHSLSGTPKRDARKYLADMLAREGVRDINRGVTPSRQGVATVADVSHGARGALEGITNDVTNPGIRARAARMFKRRNADQMHRVWSDLDEGLDLTPETTLRGASDHIKRTRAMDAEKNYRLAREAPISYNRAMRQAMRSDEVKKAFEIGRDRLKIRRLNGERLGPIDLIDEAKQQLDDDIGALMRAGRYKRARQLTIEKNKLLKEVDTQNPQYKVARDSWAGDTSMLEAGELGKKIFREDIDDLTDFVKNMSQSEQVMFRLGAKKALREKMMQARRGNNSVTRVMGELNLQKMRHAFPRPRDYVKFRRELDMEMSIFDTSTVLQNSQTAFRQAAQKDMNRGGSGEFAEGLRGPIGQITKAVDQLLDPALTIEAREELGKILLTPLADLPENFQRKLAREVAKRARAPDAALQIMNTGLGTGPLAAGAIAMPIMEQH